MLQLIYTLIHIIQPWLILLCFITAWAFILILAGTLWGVVIDTTKRAKKMHQIPCSTCQYFTNDYRLKCPVYPLKANTEEAINCQDYHVRESY